MRSIFVFLILVSSVLISQAQSIKDIKGNYDAEVDIVAMITGFNPEGFEPKMQITDTFAFEELEKHFSSPKTSEQIADTFSFSELEKHFNSPQESKQIADNFSFSELEKNFDSPKENTNNNVKVSITDNYIILDAIGGIKKKLEFNPKDVKVEDNKYIITTKEKEQVILIKEKDYIYIDYSKNKLKIKR